MGPSWRDLGVRYGRASKAFRLGSKKGRSTAKQAAVSHARTSLLETGGENHRSVNRNSSAVRFKSTHPSPQATCSIPIHRPMSWPTGFRRVRAAPGANTSPNSEPLHVICIFPTACTPHPTSPYAMRPTQEPSQCHLRRYPRRHAVVTRGTQRPTLSASCLRPLRDLSCLGRDAAK